MVTTCADMLFSIGFNYLGGAAGNNLFRQWYHYLDNLLFES